MEHSQTNSIKILIAVEGQKTEADFFKQFTAMYDIKAELFIVATNLYSLYDKMKKYEFQANVKDVLKEIVSSDTDKESLEQDFTYTYLVFDSELQHKTPDKRGKSIPFREIVKENFDKLIEMAKYFNNETDPTIGRLYINYPMMESYRYCDSFCDEEYLKAFISIDDIHKFKIMASKKKLAGKCITDYSKENFSDLMKLNVQKLNILSNDNSLHSLSYNDYLKISSSKSVADKQYKIINKYKKICVLNSSLFLVLDYYGNRDSFYDIIIGNCKN